MIEKLIVENFQSHAKSEISFSPNVTIITGRSQSGKTAILRALNWLIENRPKGFRFHSYFSDDSTKVKLILDGSEIIHSKSDSKESYLLNKKSFEGVGFSVPDEIKNFLNIGLINIQEQLEGPFLITSSPGNIARVVNEITNLDKVDEWVSSLTSKVNEILKNIIFTENEIQDLNNRILRYDGIEEIEDLLKLLSSLSDKIEENESFIFSIRGMIDDYQFCQKTLEGLTWIDEASDLLLQIEKEEKEIKLILELLSYKDDLDFLNERVKLIEEIISCFDELCLVGKYISDYDRFKFMLLDQENLEKGILEEENEIVVFKEQYFDILKKNKLCPVCFSVVEESLLKRLEDYI